MQKIMSSVKRRIDIDDVGQFKRQCHRWTDGVHRRWLEAKERIGDISMSQLRLYRKAGRGHAKHDHRIEGCIAKFLVKTGV